MNPDDKERQQVKLELDHASEPIAGRLVAADGAASEFTGYLALIEAIEAIRSQLREGEACGGD